VLASDHARGIGFTAEHPLTREAGRRVIAAGTAPRIVDL
jgi:hypothetical protein